MFNPSAIIFACCGGIGLSNINHPSLTIIRPTFLVVKRGFILIPHMKYMMCRTRTLLFSSVLSVDEIENRNNLKNTSSKSGIRSLSSSKVSCSTAFRTVTG